MYFGVNRWIFWKSPNVVLTKIQNFIEMQSSRFQWYSFVFAKMQSHLVCVRFSSETTQPISPMMIPINWGNSVDVQHALNFDLDPSMTAGQGREIHWFWEFRCLICSSLCSLLLWNYSTDFSNDDTNQLREQCRCTTCTSFWPCPFHDCRSRSQNTSILWI